MKRCIRSFTCLAFALSVGNVTAQEEASVTIKSPANGAILDVMEQNKVEYEAVQGPRGDHMHFYVDGEEVAILRQLAGSYTLESLTPGTHELCVKIVNKNHTPIGVGECIDVTLE
ncbi:MAG: hypothetical protein WCZ87_06250 [Thiohalobacteraceae bacterium]